jgi:tRNA G46 methylase TrmB
MGSGSTIIACKKTNRKYIGIEMNTEIFDKAMKNIKSFIST